MFALRRIISRSMMMRVATRQIHVTPCRFASADQPPSMNQLESMMNDPHIRETFEKLSRHPPAIAAMQKMGDVIKSIDTTQAPSKMDIMKLMMDKEFRDAATELTTEMQNAGVEVNPDSFPQQPGLQSCRGTNCTKAKVAILGAGVAGIAAAQNLTNAGIEDFVIVEYNDYIGGRMRNSLFGKNADGKPYTIEFGANWVEGIGSLETHENPIWKLAEKYNLKSAESNYDSYKTFDHKGATNWSGKIKEFDEFSDKAAAEAGRLLLENLQDTSVRAALRTAGWRPAKDDMHAQAADWWGWDFESAWTPDESGLIYGIVGGNASFGYFSNVSNLVFDQRGFSTIIQGEAKEFLKDGDNRLQLSTTVEGIEYDKKGAKVTIKGGDCIEADYVICTFSLGVLQSDRIDFKPGLPGWKQSAIDQFAWAHTPKSLCNPIERGRFLLFQSLNAKGFAEGSNILFGTLTGEKAWRVERQTNEETEEQILEVLQLMFPDKTIPKPTAFTYPRWSTEPWAYGSYSNWPVGMTLEKHQNMRANVERL
ncbi:hypothetical protein F53441_7219 [Fusarium austroafricanum]|uniref:Amine oxidase domain-containing protein n=1 Tax=Fusarium austroafricanum TaxID=2364996 RepID=A0A8H4KHZ5_9HYPO|nr:hypothetical protein F53441_7219 [Fusarium austroafricanum]